MFLVYSINFLRLLHNHKHFIQYYIYKIIIIIIIYITLYFNNII